MKPIECDVCGHAYTPRYMTETVMGEGTAQETITHCRGGHCASEEAHQEHHTETLRCLETRARVPRNRCRCGPHSSYARAYQETCAALGWEPVSLCDAERAWRSRYVSQVESSGRPFLDDDMVANAWLAELRYYAS